MATNPIPDGYPALYPKLTCKDAARAIDFYKQAFGAVEAEARITGPDGRIGHAVLRIGDSPFTLHDEHPEMNFVGPETLGGTPVAFQLHVDDVDKVFERAIAAGAREIIPVADQFYGHRSGRVMDPFGHYWILSTQIEELTAAEVQERAAKFYGA